MNGRCETDPFDQAVDVCQSCYGEFCSACLLVPKGRKHPVCKDCAVISSGVRPGAKHPVRGERKTLKQRRKHLRAQPSQDTFRFFDEDTVDDHVSDLDGVAGIDGDEHPDVQSLNENQADNEANSEGEADNEATADHDLEPAIPARSGGSISAIEQLDRIRQAQVPPDLAAANLAALRNVTANEPARGGSERYDDDLPMPSPDIDPFAALGSPNTVFDPTTAPPPTTPPSSAPPAPVPAALRPEAAPPPAPVGPESGPSSAEPVPAVPPALLPSPDSSPTVERTVTTAIPPVPQALRPPAERRTPPPAHQSPPPVLATITDGSNDGGNYRINDGSDHGDNERERAVQPPAWTLQRPVDTSPAPGDPTAN